MPGFEYFFKMYSPRHSRLYKQFAKRHHTDTMTGDIINRVNIDSVASAGVVVDPNTHTLYRMQEGAFGNLEIINLVTGESYTHQALYLAGYLN